MCQCVEVNIQNLLQTTISCHTLYAVILCPLHLDKFIAASVYKKIPLYIVQLFYLSSDNVV